MVYPVNSNREKPFFVLAEEHAFSKSLHLQSSSNPLNSSAFLPKYITEINSHIFQNILYFLDLKDIVHLETTCRTMLRYTPFFWYNLNYKNPNFVYWNVKDYFRHKYESGLLPMYKTIDFFTAQKWEWICNRLFSFFLKDIIELKNARIDIAKTNNFLARHFKNFKINEFEILARRCLEKIDKQKKKRRGVKRKLYEGTHNEIKFGNSFENNFNNFNNLDKTYLERVVRAVDSLFDIVSKDFTVINEVFFQQPASSFVVSYIALDPEFSDREKFLGSARNLAIVAADKGYHTALSYMINKDPKKEWINKNWPHYLLIKLREAFYVENHLEVVGIASHLLDRKFRGLFTLKDVLCVMLSYIYLNDTEQALKISEALDYKIALPEDLKSRKFREICCQIAKAFTYLDNPPYRIIMQIYEKAFVKDDRFLLSDALEKKHFFDSLHKLAQTYANLEKYEKAICVYSYLMENKESTNNVPVQMLFEHVTSLFKAGIFDGLSRRFDYLYATYKEYFSGNYFYQAAYASCYLEDANLFVSTTHQDEKNKHIHKNYQLKLFSHPLSNQQLGEQFATPLKWCQIALKKEPNNVSVLLFIAILNVHINCFKDALHYFSRLDVFLKDRHPNEYFVNHATAHYHCGNYSESAELYKKYQQLLEDKNSDNYKQFYKDLNSFLKPFNNDPLKQFILFNYRELWKVNAIFVYSKIGYYEEIIRLYCSCKEPLPMESLCDVAGAYASLGYIREACEIYKSLPEIYAVDSLYIGRIYFQNGDFSYAANCFKAAYNLDASSFSKYDLQLAVCSHLHIREYLAAIPFYIDDRVVGNNLLPTEIWVELFEKISQKENEPLDNKIFDSLADLLLQHAREYVLTKMYVKASSCYEAAIKVQGNLALKDYLNIAYINLKLGNFESSAYSYAAYEKEVGLDNLTDSDLLRSAYVHTLKKDWISAARLYQRLLQPEKIFARSAKILLKIIFNAKQVNYVLNNDKEIQHLNRLREWVEEEAAKKELVAYSPPHTP